MGVNSAYLYFEQYLKVGNETKEATQRMHSNVFRIYTLSNEREISYQCCLKQWYFQVVFWGMGDDRYTVFFQIKNIISSFMFPREFH